MDEHPQILFIYIDLTFVLVGIINPNSAGLLDVVRGGADSARTF